MYTTIKNETSDIRAGLAYFFGCFGIGAFVSGATTVGIVCAAVAAPFILIELFSK